MLAASFLLYSWAWIVERRLHCRRLVSATRLPHLLVVCGGLLGDMLSHLLLCDCATLAPGWLAMLATTLWLVVMFTASECEEMSSAVFGMKEHCCQPGHGKGTLRSGLRVLHHSLHAC